MASGTDSFSTWLAKAAIAEQRLTPEQRAVLQAVFRFRQQQGHDYYSTRLLSHFLIHCDCGLKIAQVARLLGLSRPTASRQQGLSSKQAIQQAHHRMDGRPYGKLLPRYAGPIAEFLLTHPEATRADTLDFIERTFTVRVSTVALYKFLKKYGLDAATRQAAAAATPATPAPPSAPATPRRSTARTAGGAPPARSASVGLPPPVASQPGQPVPPPAPPFSSRRRSTRAPS